LSKKRKYKLSPVDKKLMQLMRKAADHGRFEQYVRLLMDETCSPLPMYRKYNSNDAKELQRVVTHNIVYLANKVARERPGLPSFTILDTSNIFNRR
jgi:predicted metal-binding protein